MRFLILIGIVLVGLAVAGAGLAKGKPGFEYYVSGDVRAPTPGKVSGGLLLMGGGDRHHDAMRWFFNKAGGGHIVVLRASYAGEIGEEFVKEIGGVASAETFVFHDRGAATNPRVLRALHKADGIFIAGGDQSNYVRYWKGTPVAKALDAHVAAGKPIAGTSAGLAMLGELLYGAMDGGSLASPEALADPFGPANTLETGFLHIALLKGVITDTHFKERSRLGRLFAFLAKGQAMRPSTAPALIGLGVDEDASLAIEPDGSGRIYAAAPGGGAWVVEGDRLRGFKADGPLRADRVKVTGVSTASIVHLPSGRVDRPSFVRFYAAADGRITEMPSALHADPISRPDSVTAGQDR